MTNSIEKARKEKSKSIKFLFALITIALLMATFYGVFVYSVFQSEKHVELVTSLSLAFSALALAGTIANWILVAAKLLSTHEFRIMDIRSAVPGLKKEEKQNPPESKMEEAAIQQADDAVDKLFGRRKEPTLTDQI